MESIEKFHEQNDVVYEMRVKVNGETIVEYFSDQSFEDVSMFSHEGDEAMDKHILQSKQDLKDLRASDATEDALDEQAREGER